MRQVISASTTGGNRGFETACSLWEYSQDVGVLCCCCRYCAVCASRISNLNISRSTLRILPMFGSILTKSVFQGGFSVFSPEYFREKPRNSDPEKRPLEIFLRFFRNFRYNTVEHRAAPPLELCHHSRAHRADRGRS